MESSHHGLPFSVGEVELRQPELKSRELSDLEQFPGAVEVEDRGTHCITLHAQYLTLAVPGGERIAHIAFHLKPSLLLSQLGVLCAQSRLFDLCSEAPAIEEGYAQGKAGIDALG